MRVVVASGNALKVQAVRDGLRGVPDLRKAMEGEEEGVVGFAVGSGVAEQPLGSQEGLCGALQRARNARERAVAEKEKEGEEESFLVVSMENFVEVCTFGEEELCMDIAAVVVLVCRGDREVHRAVSFSAGIPLPVDAFEEAKRLGFDTTTVGAVLSKRDAAINSADPHSFFTQGAISRQQLLADAVTLAASQLRLEEL